MKLTSLVFTEGGRIPSKYTCEGLNISPDLSIGNLPANTKSLAIIVDDPDAPGGNWDHWIVWNMAPNTATIAENSVPNGAVEGRNDFRKTEYGGPCPPRGVHHYQFKLYALDVTLDLLRANKNDLEKAMQGHVLDQATLVGLYSRE